MHGLRTPAGYNRSPCRNPPRDRGRNDSARPQLRPGRSRPNGGLGIDTRTSLADLTSSPRCETGPRPRLRGVSHQLAFFVAVPLGVALALSAHGTVGASRDRVRGERRRDVRRQHALPPALMGAARQPANRPARPRDDLRADRRHLRAGRAARHPSGLARADPRGRLGRGVPGDRSEARLARRADLGRTGDRASRSARSQSSRFRRSSAGSASPAPCCCSAAGSPT